MKKMADNGIPVGGGGMCGVIGLIIFIVICAIVVTCEPLGL